MPKTGISAICGKCGAIRLWITCPPPDAAADTREKPLLLWWCLKWKKLRDDFFHGQQSINPARPVLECERRSRSAARRLRGSRGACRRASPLAGGAINSPETRHIHW
jgi:hypothetical protein